MVIVELEEQLIAQEREMDSQEDAIVMWEEGLVALACARGGECGTFC
jgi:hypothetical protein